MPLDIAKITAALNAYPWMRGAYSIRGIGGASYCAVGLLLRYAGVAQNEIACSVSPHDILARYRELLECEYGITDPTTIIQIILANDAATTHEQAIEWVQSVLDGGNLADLVRDRDAAERLAAEARSLEDGGSCSGALVM